MFNNITWLFFDIGSTIINEQWAYEHRMKDIAKNAMVTYDEVYKRAIRYYKQNKKGDLETAKDLGIELTKWYTEDEALYPDAPKTLEYLSKKYKIGIIANQPSGTERRLEKHGLIKYINLVIASDEEGVSKPNKRIFEIAIERSKSKPENTIMIGDRIDNDIVPAKELGMQSIWIKQGFGQYWQIMSEKERPDYTINCLSELLDIL